MTKPSLSAVICTHNRADNIRTVLPTLFAQQLDEGQQLEIIVVPNGCTDDTVQTVERLKADSPFPLQCIELPEGNLSAARNAGVEAAHNDIVAFLDDDVRTFPDWAYSMLHAFERDGVDIVGGQVELWFRDVAAPDWLDHYHRRLLSENMRGDAFRPAGVADVFGCNFAVRKTVFTEVAGFDRSLGRQSEAKLAGEEADFVSRALQQGHQAWYAPDVRVEHLVSADRLTEDYLSQCALGAGRAYAAIHVDARYDLARILDLSAQLVELGAREAATRDNDYKQYIYFHTRRCHLYGELTEALRILFGAEAIHPALQGQADIPSYRELQAALDKLSHFPPATQPPRSKDAGGRIEALARASMLQRFGADATPLTVALDEPLKPPYAIEAAYLADPREGRIYHAFSEGSPPMPLLAGPALAVYQVAEDLYSIGLGPGAQFRYEHPAGSDWMHLGLSVDEQLQARLYLNGEPVAEFQYAQEDDALVREIRIGGGYMKRHWDGWLAHVRIGRAPLREPGFTPVLKPGRNDDTLVYYNGHELER